MSVAILPMAQELAYDDEARSAIASSFFWGYTVSNLVAGSVVSSAEANPRLILAVAITVWSLFTLLTPTAAVDGGGLGGGLGLLFACRVAMGLAQGFCLPSIQRLLAEYVDEAERSRATALVFSGLNLGTIACFATAPAILAASADDWHALFFLYGALGFGWLVAWLPATVVVPEVAQAATRTSLSLGASLRKMRGLLGKKSVRGVAMAYLANNVGYLIILALLPSYFAQKWSVSAADASHDSILPYVSTFLAANAAGVASDAAIGRGVSLVNCRRGAQALASFGPALCLTALDFAPSLEVAELCVTLALALTGIHCVGIGAAPIDLSKNDAPLIYGMVNSIGCAAGSVAILGAGSILDVTHSYDLVFGFVAFVYVVGGLGFITMYDAKPLDGGPGKEKEPAPTAP